MLFDGAAPIDDDCKVDKMMRNKLHSASKVGGDLDTLSTIQPPDVSAHHSPKTSDNKMWIRRLNF